MIFCFYFACLLNPVCFWSMFENSPTLKNMRMVYYSYDITPQGKYMLDDYGVVGTLSLRSRKKALSSTQFFFFFFSFCFLVFADCILFI